MDERDGERGKKRTFSSHTSAPHIMAQRYQDQSMLSACMYYSYVEKSPFLRLL